MPVRTKRTLSFIIALALGFVLASCVNSQPPARPTPLVTVISATAVPTTAVPTTAPAATAEQPAVLPADPAPTEEPAAELPDAESSAPNPPLGADLELVPGVVDYSLGEGTIVQERFPEDSRFRDMPVRLEGVIAVPETTALPAPLVMILHGNHIGCPVDPDRPHIDPWPCSTEEEQANYKGFDYLVKALADAGYVAVSINVNGEYTLGFGEGDLGERMGQIIRLHLGALEEATQGGDNEFGVDLAGRIDMGRVAFIGHSMGGELASRLTNQEGWASPYSLIDNGFGPVDGLLLVAPSLNAFGSTGGDIPVATLLPACDGDVVQLSGQSFYEAVRADPTDGQWATSVTIERGNHNGFNRILRSDSSRGPGCDTVLPAADQQAFLVDYARDFLAANWAAPPEKVDAAGRLGLGATAPAPSELGGLAVRTVTMVPNRRALLRAIDETEVQEALSSGRLRAEGVDVLFCPEGFFIASENPIAEDCRRPNTTQPGNPAQVIVSWSAPGGELRFNLPEDGRDVSSFRSLSLRAAVDPLSELNAEGAPQSFSVTITDSAGQSATVVVPGTDPALQYPAGTVSELEFLTQGLFDGIIHMSDIRLPLDAFETVDLTDVASVGLRFDQTATGSLFMADVELVRPDATIGAYSSLLQGMASSAAGLRGIGRFDGKSNCTATLIDVGGDGESPAYVLTNGHCAQAWDANAVFTDLPADAMSMTFNYFADTVDRQVKVPVSRVAYSTMKGRDVAIVELATSVGELAAQGIVPIPLAATGPQLPSALRVIGAPTTGVPSDIAYLREELCRASGQANLSEFIWHFDDALRTGCQDIYGGSSGSPVFAAGGNEVLALINTTTLGGITACAAGAPCEVAPDGIRLVPDTSYATPVAGVGGCFADGRFDLALETCPLDGGQQLIISGTPGQPIRPTSTGTDGQSVNAAWNATLSGDQPFYRTKTGPAEAVDCRSEDGYGDVIALSDQQRIDDPLPDVEGSYVLCVVAGPSAVVDETWQPSRFATSVRAEIDTTPPRRDPFINMLRLGDTISVEPIFNPPELSDYRLKVGPADTTDCAVDTGYIRYRRIPISTPAEQLPLRVCVIGSDVAGNEGAPVEHIIPLR